jgi:hypothetical protein
VANSYKYFGRVHFPGRARRVETVNRSHCVSDLNREKGSPFWERPSICHKEKRGTCLAKIRSVDAGSVHPRCNEKREHIKRADVRLPTWDPRGFFMTCDLGHVVSRPPLFHPVWDPQGRFRGHKLRALHP